MKNNTITGSTIFVTGGAGFIGSYVIEQLLLHNPKKIIIVDNFIRGNYENMKSFVHKPQIECIKGDIRDTGLMDTCISRADFVFHMAALRINACMANTHDAFDVMLKSTFDIANLCVKHKIKKIIYSSSASIYGLAQHFPTPETDNPYDNQTFYGNAKLWGEQLFRSYKFMYGLDYCALRYFNVYGPRMDTDGKYTEVIIKWLDCIRNKTKPVIYGNGKDSMDFVFVEDVAKANVLALINKVTGETFNIGNGTETSLKQLLTTLLRVNNSTLQPVFKKANSYNPVSRRLAGIQKAQKILGFKPKVDLEHGLQQLSKWYFDTKKR